MNVLSMGKFFTAIIISLFSLCASAQGPVFGKILTTSTLYCTGTPITLIADSASPASSFTWAVVPSKGLSAFTDLNSPTVTLTFSGTATYTVYLNIMDSSGNLKIVYKIISPGRSANASFNASLSSDIYPAKLTLTNYSAHSLRNYWRFSDSSIPDTSFSLVKDYPATGNYSVFLFAYGAKGCNDSASYKFDIAEFSDLTLPNIFTPNGDGINDVYKPVTKGISSLNAWVHNRYGVLVCSWDKPKGGWDGHTTSGEECSAGVYFITLEALGFDGKTYKLKGTITLIR